jgi:hypothetical protein
MSGKPCLNCGNQLAPNDNYCSHCGQSVKEVTLSLTQIIKDGFASLVNWDSRLLHTIRDIFKPYLLTKTYVEGKRRYYVNPARLFVFTLLSFFSIFFLTSGKDVNIDLENDFQKMASRLELGIKYDSLAHEIFPSDNQPEIDTLKSLLFGNLIAADDTLNLNIDFLYVDFSSYGIKTRDIYLLPVNKLIDKYKIEKFSEKLLLNQGIHFTKDASGGFRFIIKNFSYAAFILVIFGALLLKLLYIRSPYYYVEHLVLIFYSHTLVLLLLIPIVLANWLNYYPEIVTTFSFLLLMINQFITKKKYYKQGWLKTLIKQVIFNTGYIFILGFCIVFISIISLFLF